MKKIIFLALGLCNVFFIAAQYDMNCQLGFSYEISKNNQWGKDRPVIMKVYQNSPADKAGIRQYDIIEEIDGKKVSEMTVDDVDSLLTDMMSSETTLGIRNFTDRLKSIPIKKECRSIYSFSENQLATAFSMYSVENTHDRLFVCPFTTSATQDEVDFSKFSSFDFAPVEDTSIVKIETTLNEILKTELVKKGLTYNTLNPDFIIYTYYKFDKNANFKRKSRETENQAPTIRYDITRDRLVNLPFYNMSTPESESEYILQLGVRFVDNQNVRGRVLWESEANELMSAPYAIEEYATIHLPLMCMQFPYIKYNRNAQFILAKKGFNYTGINYSINQINQVIGVDADSPAAEAGILPGDVIEKIENRRMDYSVEEFTAAYRTFISNTMKYRDFNTRFTDANGFPNCMFWDTFKYTQISKALNQTKYKSAFAYLYGFASYVNPERNSVCTFNIRRADEKLEIIVRPVFYSETTIEIN
ncbi:MAG: PDZ domain-containing protein [Tannerella sp.]|jgi:hypothetical protein|nr:PDZ domain-containing protein [Tannerella sp.]